MTFKKFIGGLAAALMILFVLILIVILWTMNSLKDSTQKALDPVNQASGYVATQVSNVLNPVPTVVPDPVTILREVRSLARLETVQYSMERVITAESGQGAFGFLVGDKLLFVAHGVVIAGVDLSKMDETSIKSENGILKVRLPEAEIFVATLDNEKSYVYDRNTGILNKGNVTLESLARQTAESEIKKAAVEDGILKTAQQNAENYLYRLLRQLGFAEVIFE
ncbi:MAG TPA: DUF4230 domain-containing protein [Bellilinea sp.]|nr:DUF4230 domain-containing protein [Bellilinea sp.]